MARLSFATWMGPTPNQSGPMQEQRGLVLHIMQGSYEGSIAWGKNPASSVSFHFATAKDGRLGQLVDTDITAWTQGNGNGSWISVENEGYSGQPLADAQIENCAQIYAWGVQTHGWPLQTTDSPNGYGLGWHGMGGAGWGGHFDCPGEPIKAQRAAILARAEEIIGGDMADSELVQALAWRMDALTYGHPTTIGGPTEGEGMWTTVAIQELRDGIRALSTGGIDVDALADQIATKLAANTEFIGAVANATADVQASRLQA